MESREEEQDAPRSEFLHSSTRIRLLGSSQNLCYIRIRQCVSVFNRSLLEDEHNSTRTTHTDTTDTTDTTCTTAAAATNTTDTTNSTDIPVAPSAGDATSLMLL